MQKVTVDCENCGFENHFVSLGFSQIENSIWCAQCETKLKYEVPYHMVTYQVQGEVPSAFKGILK